MKQLIWCITLLFAHFNMNAQTASHLIQTNNVFKINEDYFKYTTKFGRIGYRDYTNRILNGSYEYIDPKTVLFVCNYLKYDGNDFMETYINNEKFYLLINKSKDELTDKYNFLLGLTDEQRGTLCDSSKNASNIFFTQQKKELDSLQNVIIKLNERKVEMEEKISKKIDSFVATKPFWIYDWNIQDASEYVNGTNFTFSILNTSNIDIKYIWVDVIGYNPVKDKIIDPSTQKAIKQVTCIGPIKKNIIAKYEFEYLWKTDLVETAKIVQIKIQYMNGTIKIFSKPDNYMFNDEMKSLFTKINYKD